MLWLAGLMGIVGAGAASIVMTPVDSTPNDPEDDTSTPHTTDKDNGDLLDQIKGYSEVEDDQLASLVSDLDALGDRQTSGTPAPLEEPLFSNGGALHDFPDGSEKEEGFWAEDFEEPAIGGADIEIDAQPVGLGDWILEGQTAEAVDYDARNESLVLVWDDLAGDPQEPTVRVESDPDDEEVMHIMMNDASVAEIYGDPDLDPGDITMIPLSSALIVGLEPA